MCEGLAKDDLPEVDIDGWNKVAGVYSFLYQDIEGTRDPFQLKCLRVGDNIVLHWALMRDPRTPSIQDFNLDRYTTADSNVPQMYQHVDELITMLDDTLGKDICYLEEKEGKAFDAAEGKIRSEEEGFIMSGEMGVSKNLKDKEEEPRSSHDFDIPRSSVGYEDIVPPGCRPPGLRPVVRPEGMPHPGGGMHVGPDHPIFGGGKLGRSEDNQSRNEHGGILPPGARWDPIGPPGTQGFRPEDFQRQQGKPHPDMMQPGPGRTDWDSFFG